MATTKLGNKAVGDVVKLNVNGAAREFLIVHQGKPSSIYDDSCDGTWLLMKDIYEKRVLNNSVSAAYAASTMHTYLNSTFLNLFDENIKEQIKHIKLPYLVGNGGSSIASGASGLDAQIFMLSGYECGWTNSNISVLPADGAKLDYFVSGSDGNSKRIAYLNGAATIWWTRSVSSNYTNDVICAAKTGSYTYSKANASQGIRPALVLPKTLSVSDDGTVSTNAAPTISSTSGASGVNLGTKSAAFSFQYTPSDADGDKLTVVEKLDGVTMKTRTNVTSGTALTFECASTAAAFQKILNGSHTISIEVSDGQESVSFTASFTKAVYAASITLETPLTAAGDITLAIMNIVGSIPDDAVFTVEATNNAKDASPVWQDVTSEVKKNQNIMFTNTVAEKGAAFNFRINVKRGSSGEGGYISAVTGAFQ
uniref:Tail protein n=1 Tax=Caudovirales sp. ctu3532 TaxID=2827639 RepID=A0A8S5TIE6_9CAUD|nr:MAG TPA: tail protein [Caudovirales sp. ctu3532]